MFNIRKIDKSTFACGVSILLSIGALGLAVYMSVKPAAAVPRVGTIKYELVRSKSSRIAAVNDGMKAELNKISEESREKLKTLPGKTEKENLRMETVKQLRETKMKSSKETLNVIREASDKVAKEKNLTMIVSSVLVFTDSVDVTDDVLKEIDKK